MKVLFIVHALPEHNFGGVELYTYNLATAMQKQGLNIAIAYPGHDCNNINYENINLYNICIDKDYRIDCRCTDLFRDKFNTLLDEIKPDIVHIENFFSMPADICSIIKEKNIPLIISLHDWYIVCPQIHMHGKLGLCEEVKINTKCSLCLYDSIDYQGILNLKQRLNCFSCSKR